MLYVTPHRWTLYYRLAAHRRVIRTDRRLWNYKHQVLATRHVPPWSMLAWFKHIEMVVQGRPRALARVLLHPDRGLRHAMRWYTRMGRRVWPPEILGWLRDPPARSGPSVAEFWGAAQDAEEEAMAGRTGTSPARRESALGPGRARRAGPRRLAAPPQNGFTTASLPA